VGAPRWRARGAQQGAVDEAQAAAGDELGDAELHPRDLRRQAPQAAVETRLTSPVTAWATASAISS
jgi:hypothetical protein